MKELIDFKSYLLREYTTELPKPLDWSIYQTDNDGSEYRFKLGDREYSVYFSIDDEFPVFARWDFESGGGFDEMTNDFNSKSKLSTLLSILRDFLNKNTEVGAIGYTASNKRFNIYSKIFSNLLNKSTGRLDSINTKVPDHFFPDADSNRGALYDSSFESIKRELA